MEYEKPSENLTFYKAFFLPQWKFLIHTILQCLSAKTTSWNEFSSTMASAIICLANNQKFNFSMYILTSLVKNLEASVPFYMFPRAVTPLFGTMMVQALEKVGDLLTGVQDTPIPDDLPSFQPQRKHKPRRKQRMLTEVSPTETNTEEHVPTPSNDLLPSVQTSGSGNTFLLAVAFFFRQWEVLSGSENFLTSSGNALCILFPTILP
nr:hypothetical protein [Tanacetum cinerariifolium]